MSHKSIKFDNIHAFNDLNLLLTKAEIPPATPKTNFVDIPGGDGSIDNTEALGEVKYKDRECTFTFTVFPYDDFEVKKTQVSNLLNGTKCNIILEKDPDYYWVGRCVVNNYASDRNHNTIVVNATVAPYKMRTNATEVIFESGANITKSLSNSRKTVVPTITNNANATVVFKGKAHELTPGTHRIADIELKQGENTITVTSNDIVRFSYREGDL